MKRPLSTTPSTSRTRTGSRRRVPSWIFALLVPVCAVAPWVVPWPWQGEVAAPSADPSVFIKQATAPRSDPKTGTRAKANPSAASVKSVNDQVAKAALSGYDQPVTAAAAAGVRTTPGKYQPVGRIKIARMGLDVPYGEGVYASALDHGPGHWPGTPLPGQSGTSVLSGHRNTHTAPFRYLNWLKPGDKIVVTTGKGDPVTFRVDDTTIVPEAKYPAFVLKPAKNPDAAHLTLFACHPEGNPIFRIVVRATVSSAYKAASADKGKG